MASTQNSSQSSSSQGTSYSGISDPQALATLRAYILEQAAGGTPDYLRQRAVREQAYKNAAEFSNDWTTEAAFADAADLMKLNLQQSMEKQMPALAKSVQGAGTSASSMQGLLSNKIAQDAALGAGALGAEQAKAYAAAQSSLQGTLEKFTNIDVSNETNFLRALDLFQVSQSQQTSQSQGSSSGSNTGSSGGGSSSGVRAASAPSGSYVRSAQASGGTSAAVANGNPVDYYDSGSGGDYYGWDVYPDSGGYTNYDPGYGYDLGTPGYEYTGSGQEYGGDYLDIGMTQDWGGSSDGYGTTYPDTVDYSWYE